MNLEKKLKISIAITVMLCVALCMTSFAMAILASSYVQGNSFATGVIDVSVSEKGGTKEVDGFAPGMTLEKCYVVTNESPVDIWYRVCFEGVDGLLGEIVTLTVEENEGERTVLYQGPAEDFVEGNEAIAVGEAIPAKSSREVLVTFFFPEDAGNAYQEESFSFDFFVRAVQKKNNPDQKFK